MSQSGKVYHVYVEVRDGEGLDPLMLQGPDVLPQRTSPHLGPSPTSSPGMLHKGGGSNQSLSSNKSSSRHSVSFHLGPAGDEQGHETLGPHRQSLPYDGFSHLLSTLQSGHNGILMRAHSTESEPLYARENHVAGRYTAPPTPSAGRRSYYGTPGGRDVGGEGRRSVVTFSYIEKGSVQAAGAGPEGSHGSLCQSEPENPFNRALEEEEGTERSASLMRKRLSDPVRFSSWDSLGVSGPKLTSAQSHALNLRRATLDSIAREATYRALEEFGSPQIRRRLETQSHHPHSHDQPPHDQPRCRSWGGSPVLPVRSACTLPTNTHLADLDRNHSAYGLPRSPASEHLSSHVRQNYYTVSPPTTRAHTYGTPNHQRQWHGETSPKLPYKHGPALPSCKPTAIQHEIPAMTVTKAPSNNHQRSSHHSVDSPRSSHRVNFNLDAARGSKAGTDETTSYLSGRKSVSPSTSPELARKLAEEASKLSTIFAERRSPSPVPSSGEETNHSDSPRSGSLSRESQVYASLQGLGSPAQSHADVSLPVGQLGDHHWATERESVRSTSQSGHTSPLPPYRTGTTPSPALARMLQHRLDMTPSPIRDPRLETDEFVGNASPTPHRHQPPQYTGDSWTSGGSDHQQQPARYNPQPRDSSTEGQHRGYYSGHHSTDSPVSWTSQLQRWREERQMRVLDRSGQPPPSSSRVDDKGRRDVPEAERGGGGGGGGGTPGLSKSSSGVTGSLGDSSSQPDRDCLSTESSSQASRRSSDSGNNADGAQSEGSSALGSSIRSEKIARAKWEFLFGAPTQDQPETRDPSGASTVPSSGRSGKPATPSSSSATLPRKPQRSRKPAVLRKDEIHRLSYHEVQQVEVELVAQTPPSSACHTSPGTSPRMGIIRRTIKYSETDLDAVPMRCYRETDLDEVMQARHEEEEPGSEGVGNKDDSAFKSERSGRGTLGRSRSGARGRVERVVEDEEGVVSWATVRMLGDRKRQAATRPHEEDEVLSRLLKGSSDSHIDNQSTLKSPVAVGNPRRISAEGLDTFSRHFENIIESHRAKGTSYSSLDSEDMTPSGPPIFTFDLPTLTPEIQSQICASARQLSELGFAPLARPEGLSLSDRTGGSDPTLAPFKEELGSGSDDDATNSATDGPASERSPDSPLREKPCLHIPESDPEVAERLALGSPDNLSNGNKADLEAAKRLAKRLYKLDGFRKSDVARHLGKNNDFSRMVAEEYLSFFNFTGMNVDQALRAFLKEFALMGETQERERVLSHFSKRYLQCNPNTIPSEDSVHTLTCALMLLNTDLHGHNIGKRMSCMQFIGNLEGLNDGQDFPRELLKALYHSIKNEKLQWTIDEEELRKSFSELAESRTDSASHTMKRINSGGNPLVSVAQQSNAQLYKNGFLVRKVHADVDGKRTPRGKRGWKSFYAILKGLVLYLQKVNGDKGEYRPDKLTDEDLKNAVSIHHSLAMKAADYSKRPNVFYLRTADWRVFLFQAPNAEQMQSWITRINTVASMFSAPPFPAAIGSQKKFSRPLLPGSTTKLTQEEQVQSHETRFRAVSSELTELRAVPPDRKVKGRELEEYKQREEYLDFEKTRYGTYAMLLRAKIRSGETDLAAFEARLFADSGLQRAHSSPTLAQETCSSQASSSSSSSSSGGGSSAGGSSGRSAAAAQSSASASGSGSASGSRRGKRAEGPRHSYRKAVKQ